MEEEAKEAARTGKLQRTVSMNTYDRYIALQRSKRGALRTWARLYDYTIGLVLPTSMRYDLDAVGDDVMVPINAARVRLTLNLTLTRRRQASRPGLSRRLL